MSERSGAWNTNRGKEIEYQELSSFRNPTVFQLGQAFLPGKVAILASYGAFDLLLDVAPGHGVMPGNSPSSMRCWEGAT